MQLVGILQYKMLYYEWETFLPACACLGVCVCVFGVVVVLTAPLGS